MGEHAAVELYWLPLGAGGHFVRLIGRGYEALVARQVRRPRRDIFHSALVVRVPDGRFVIEQAWPIANGNGAARGVVAEGPVGLVSRRMPRVLRYEVRRWRDGVIPDVAEAVASPRVVTIDAPTAVRVLDLVAAVPTPAWGRDQLSTGEMWNSNSLTSWLLERAGLDASRISPPEGGRAPGWAAGIVAARRACHTERRWRRRRGTWVGSPRSRRSRSATGSATSSSDTG